MGRVTEEGHRTAFGELSAARGRLLPAVDIRAYAELSFGMAFHLISIGAQRRLGVHREQHDGLARWLRERGQVDVADTLVELESIRSGRWYGRQGNGEAVQRIDQLLAALEAWALA